MAPTSRDRPAKSDIDPYLDVLLSNIAHSKSWHFTKNRGLNKVVGTTLRLHLIVGSCQIRSPFSETQDRALVVRYARRVYPGAKIIERD